MGVAPGGARNVALLEDVQLDLNKNDAPTPASASPHSERRPYPRWFQPVRRYLFRGWLTTTVVLFVLFVLIDFLRLVGVQ